MRQCRQCGAPTAEEFCAHCAVWFAPPPEPRPEPEPEDRPEEFDPYATLLLHHRDFRLVPGLEAVEVDPGRDDFVASRLRMGIGGILANLGAGGGDGIGA